MKRPRLFKQRQIYLPTFFGLFVIVSVLLCIGWFSVNNLAKFLAYQHPIGGDYLIVEGWLSQEALEEAVLRFKSGHYRRIITTGGPQIGRNCDRLPSYADSAAVFIVKQGIARENVMALPTPASAQDRTFLSAVIVRDWLLDNGKQVTSLDVFSGAVHARRTQLLYEMAFRQQAVEIGIIASKPNEFTLQAWWNTSVGAKAVITEAIGLLWVTCCFSPGQYGSHQEKWGIY